MYTVAVKRDFIASHFLIGGDWGPENTLHAHHYAIELRLEGAELDRHGYLVDIVDIENHLDVVVAGYRDRVLNELPPFNPGGRAINPSIEHFSRILAQELAARIQAPNLHALKVVLWENEIAWAAFRVEVG